MGAGHPRPRLSWFLAALLAASLAGVPPMGRAAAQAADAVRVDAVPDGGTLVLEDGRQVRLAGIESPAPTAAFGGESRAALARLVQGRRVRLDSGAARSDRYGRLVAQVHREDGGWVQGALVEGGFARVRAGHGDGAILRALLGIEARARAARAGLWRLAAYRVRDAGRMSGPLDQYHLVEGTVVGAERVGGRIYLNFGPDWRRDFTATIERPALKGFERAGLDPIQWKGRRLRLRGWLFERNGPMIELAHPEQVEFLD